MPFMSHRDDRLSARIIKSTPLLYDDGPDPTLDRPAHVRAASSLVWLGQSLLIFQDDARWVGVLGWPGGRVEALALDRGADGKRIHDAARGTKAWKLDLEAATPWREGEVEGVLAFGSGSTPQRETVVWIDLSGNVQEMPAPDWYRILRENNSFAGSELNLEGVMNLGDGHIRLLQRGNGAPRDGLHPQNAFADVDGASLMSYLRGAGPPPPLFNIHPCDLGQMDNVPLTFTDGCVAGGRLFYISAAEASPDTYHDGEVVGAAVGIFSGGGGRWTPLLESDGKPSVKKIEGVAPYPGRRDRLWMVVDPDDGDKPAELMEVELGGPW